MIRFLLMISCLIVSCSYSNSPKKTLVTTSFQKEIIPKYAKTYTISGQWPIEYAEGQKQIRKDIKLLFPDMKRADQDADIQILYLVKPYKIQKTSVEMEEIKFKNNLAHLSTSHKKQVSMNQVSSRFAFVIKDAKIGHIFLKKNQSLSYNIERDQNSNEVQRTLLGQIRKFLKKWLKEKTVAKQIHLVGKSDLTKRVIELTQQGKIQKALDALTQKIDEINYISHIENFMSRAQQKTLKMAYYNRSQLFKILNRKKVSTRDLKRANSL